MLAVMVQALENKGSGLKIQSKTLIFCFVLFVCCGFGTKYHTLMVPWCPGINFKEKSF